MLRYTPLLQANLKSYIIFDIYKKEEKPYISICKDIIKTVFSNANSFKLYQETFIDWFKLNNKPTNNSAIKDLKRILDDQYTDTKDPIDFLACLLFWEIDRQIFIPGYLAELRQDSARETRESEV